VPTSKKPRKKFNNRKLLMTKRARIWNAYRTFEPIYDLLTSLYDGEVDTVKEVTVISDWEGGLMEAVPALEGWVCIWDRIIKGEGLVIDLSPLRTIQQALANDDPMSIDMIEDAIKLTNRCYQAYLAIPKDRIISYSTTEQISIELEEAGLI